VLCNVLESSRGYSFCRNQPEAAQLLIDAGADVNSVAQGIALLTYAAVFGRHHILCLLAQNPSIQLNAVMVGYLLWYIYVNHRIPGITYIL